MDRHLTALDIEAYIDEPPDKEVRAGMDAHLAACAVCRRRMAGNTRLNSLLQAIPRENAPRDLAARITAAVELRVAEDRARRERLPPMIAATCFSALVTLWFAFEMVVGLQENGAFDFVSLVTSRPEILSAYSTDAFWALVESLPLPEIVLTLFALLTVVVLASQLTEMVHPDLTFYHHGDI